VPDGDHAHGAVVAELVDDAVDADPVGPQARETTSPPARSSGQTRHRSRSWDDLGSHTICAVVTAGFLAHQRAIGNDLATPRPEFRFPGLRPGDRWCVTAPNWLRAHLDGVAAPVVLSATNERVLDLVPLEVLREHAVDVPDDVSGLEG
jgi:uncharacterized protein